MKYIFNANYINIKLWTYLILKFPTKWRILFLKKLENFVNNLHKKILDKNQSVILFELLPPSDNSSDLQYLKDYAQSAVELLLSASISIDAINIPEISDEKNGTVRPTEYIPKIEPRELAQQLKEASNDKFEIILNRGSVNFAWPEQRQWLNETIHQYKIETLVLVGAGRMDHRYPGPAVNEMANFIVKNYTGCLCGGIVIQHRRKPDSNEDEPLRMITKSKNGIEFFSSQIVYEADSVKTLLKDYSELCQQKNIEPKRIFLSFAPISNSKDIEFLRWLGVKIPEEVCKNLLKSNIGISWRSVKIANTVLNEILDYVNNEKIQIPLGINIEHITPRNFDISQMFIEVLGKTYLRIN